MVIYDFFFRTIHKSELDNITGSVVEWQLMTAKYPETLRIIENTSSLIRATRTTTLKKDTTTPFAIEPVSLLFNPENIKIIGRDMWSMVENLQPDYLAGVATSGIAFAMAMSKESGVPWFYLKPADDVEKMDELNILDNLFGKRILLVDDLCGAGFTKKPIYESIKSKVTVIGIASLLEWEALSSETRMGWGKNIDVRSCFTIEEIVDHLHQIGRLSPEATKLVQAWLISKPGEFNIPTESYSNKYGILPGESVK